jgi:flagellar biosynthesis protein FlhF
MQSKRYEVATMQEATARIKKDLGPDAIILSTKKMTGRPGFLEVVAARDKTEKPLGDAPGVPRGEERQEELVTCLRQEFKDLRSHLDRLTQTFSLQRDLTDLKETMNVLFDSAAAQNAPHLRDIYRTLISNGISRHKSIQLLETIKKDIPREERDTYEKGIGIIERLIARSFPKDHRKERRIMALIGPTGVGKTTTLAKLAAHYSLDKKKKVGLITTDTFRIAAAEQLKIYAKIMDLPIQVASEKAAFLDSMATLAERDVILVDTPGRNHNDSASLNALKSILDPAVETVLLLNPVANREYLLEAADRFGLFGYDRIILTKVDECRSLGCLYDVIHDLGKPVSYVTTGQNVPRDIEPASPERLAKLILQQRLN